MKNHLSPFQHSKESDLQLGVGSWEFGVFPHLPIDHGHYYPNLTKRVKCHWPLLIFVHFFSHKTTSLKHSMCKVTISRSNIRSIDSLFNFHIVSFEIC